jgi:hypothetical protein
MTATSYSATTLSLTTFLAPNPQRQHFTSGFVNNGGPCTESNGDCASAELYLGADGMYDKVVVVPEPINTSYYRRSARQMWKEYNIDVCARTDVWTPTTGSQALWIEKKVDLLPDGLSRDWHIYYKRMEPNAFADDLESGSKHDISESPDIGGWRWGFHGSAEFHQYGPISTFIPLRSALDRTCDPGVTWCPQVLDAEWTNSYNAAHHRLEKPQIDWLVAQLDASHTCDQPAREYLALRSPRSFTLLTTVGRRHS